MPGFGSRNIGNIAKKIFNSVDIASEITKLDKKLLHQFFVILKT